MQLWNSKKGCFEEKTVNLQNILSVRETYKNESSEKQITAINDYLLQEQMQEQDKKIINPNNILIASTTQYKAIDDAVLKRFQKWK